MPYSGTRDDERSLLAQVVGGLQQRVPSTWRFELRSLEAQGSFGTSLDALPTLWIETDDEGRRMLAASLFERIDVLGLSLTATPTLDAEARGLVAALTEPVRCSIGSYGRGERTRAADNSPAVTFAIRSRYVQQEVATA